MLKIFKKFLYVFLGINVLVGVTFILSKSSCFSTKHSCEHFQQFEKYRELQHVFDACDQQILITFDVDDTLITAKDILLKCPVPLWLKVRAFLKYPSLILRVRQEQFAQIVMQQSEDFVFDPDVVQSICRLHERECVVVALTLTESGTFGTLDIPRWRADILHRFGIDFSDQFQDVFFTKLPKHHGNYPCLYKGILFTNRRPKGEVLGAFLDCSHLKPARIISFDDNACMLDSIARECAKREIPFTGYQCLGAKKFAGEWNNKRALLQLDYVMQHAKWVSDKEADALLAGKGYI